jgi:hypothetical protein
VPSPPVSPIKETLSGQIYLNILPDEKKAVKEDECHIARLNADCLYEVFLQLALLPLSSPPKFTTKMHNHMYDMSMSMEVVVQRHQSLPLLACCLVSRAWNQTARKLLMHTIVFRTKDRDLWYERTFNPSFIRNPTIITATESSTSFTSTSSSLHRTSL